MRFYRYQSKIQAFHNAILGLLSIVDGLVMVLSLGYVSTDWSLAFAAWFAKKRIARNKKLGRMNRG